MSYMATLVRKKIVCKQCLLNYKMSDMVCFCCIIRLFTHECKIALDKLIKECTKFCAETASDGDVRLVNGHNANAGNVEIYHK